MKAKKLKWFGVFGFFGFMGFLYFVNHEISVLFFFSFFSFFSFFVLGKQMEDIPDERYIENSDKAKLKSAMIPMTALFIIGWGSSFSFYTKELVVVISALGWALTLIAYAVLFVYYEKH